MPQPYEEDIVALANANTDSRWEVVTGKHAQAVQMSVPPDGEIGDEVHDVDQVLAFVAGQGEAHLAGTRRPVTANSLVFVPAGTRHNFVNTGATNLRLVTVYVPPEHAPGTVHYTKAKADAADAAEHGGHRSGAGARR
jgi:mannose-6-phosphate isomerase-like protein (cupin superfamily)